MRENLTSACADLQYQAGRSALKVLAKQAVQRVETC
jgi:hypothetical protein